MTIEIPHLVYQYMQENNDTKTKLILQQQIKCELIFKPTVTCHWENIIQQNKAVKLLTVCDALVEQQGKHDMIYFPESHRTRNYWNKQPELEVHNQFIIG